MRILAGALMGWAILSPAYGQDLRTVAVAEKNRVADCFSKMLIVVVRHRLRPRLIQLLEAGCAAERAVFREAVYENPPAEVKDFSKVMLDVAIATPVLAAMESRAIDIYERQATGECAGDGCSLKDYRSCLVDQGVQLLASLVKPVEYERQAERACAAAKAKALAAMRNDFGEMLESQIAGKLTSPVRDGIAAVLDDVRKEAVIAYAEDLAREVPGRRSCKPEMCGDRECISFVEDAEYGCAISD